jgi:hypothetical protein
VLRTGLSINVAKHSPSCASLRHELPYSKRIAYVQRLRYASFKACSIVRRGPRSGSGSTRLSLLNNIVSRDLAE